MLQKLKLLPKLFKSETKLQKAKTRALACGIQESEIAWCINAMQRETGIKLSGLDVENYQTAVIESLMAFATAGVNNAAKRVSIVTGVNKRYYLQWGWLIGERKLEIATLALCSMLSRGMVKAEDFQALLEVFPEIGLGVGFRRLQNLHETSSQSVVAWFEKAPMTTGVC